MHLTPDELLALQALVVLAQQNGNEAMRLRSLVNGAINSIVKDGLGLEHGLIDTLSVLQDKLEAAYNEAVL